MKKLLAMLLALVMVLAFVACNGNNGGQTADSSEKPTETQGTNPENTTEATEDAGESAEPAEPTPEPDPDKVPELDIMTLGNYEYGKDYISLYDQYGKDVKIADVEEDPETGFAYITIDGTKYELGLDFLTMAMVYNNDPEGSNYATADDVYAAWWRLYITRWNYLLPEVPLYSNEYYDLYNTEIKGVEEHPTNPFWGTAKALIDWTSEKKDHDIIIGGTTELSGKFRYPAFGSGSQAASDSDIQGLTLGLNTVETTKEGSYTWNDNVVKEHTEEVDADGNKTFTITIFDDLKFSDGSAVTAKDYLAFDMAMLTPVGTEAGSREIDGRTLLGWKDAYGAYTGPDSEAGTKEFAGLRLLGDYQFAVTIPADYIPYYYDISYANFAAWPKAMLLGDADIMDDGNGCYLSDSFYEKDADGKYVQAAEIYKNLTESSVEAFAKYPWSGAYVVKSFDKTDSTAVLELNPNFKGNYEGATAKIEKIIYKKVVPATQLEDFKAGGIDVIAGITGGKETDEAMKAADESNGKYAYVHYSRAGYGKLGFRCDYGPAQFIAVRQAIAYCMDRNQFAKDFTGGYGGVVDGPYYTGSWMYKAAVKQGMQLESYPTSADTAIEVLKAGGWNYNAEGGEYTEGVRYKKIPGDLINEKDKDYSSVDGTYKTVEIDGDYYMPLVINWFGTTDNPFTDQLQTGFKENPNITTAGMVVYNTLGDFNPMLDELYQTAAYGFYSGTPKYCAFNFATSFSSAAYDFSFYMTIDPSTYDDYSSYYIKDYADVLWLNK